MAPMIRSSHTIATENNAIYSLGTQQRSGEKKKTSKFRDIETSIQSNMRNKHDKFHNVYTKLV